MLNTAVGYGYRPWRALGWLLGLIAVGSPIIEVLDAHHPQQFAGAAGAPPFNAWLYTTDQLLPVVEFGYKNWTTHGWAQTTVILISAGWILATALIAATASIYRRVD